jgi:DNA replication protein DnaD
MEVNFTLNPDEPEDKRMLKRLCQADEMGFALWDINQKFRDYIKYKELSGEQYEIVEKLQEEFFDIIDEYNLRPVIEEG